MSDAKERPRLPITVTKPTPYTFDLGLLLANDPNPLQIQQSDNPEADLSSTARDGAQALLNQLLSTCSIAATSNGVLLSLPTIATSLPREKPIPPPKALTTWQKFALKKGIKAKAKSATARQKITYDEATGEWVPKWGYKGANKSAEREWIVEVDEKKEREMKEKLAAKGKGSKGGDGGDAGIRVVGGGRRERLDRIKREDRKMRANERKAAKVGGTRSS